jgi:hypothetical protein
LRTTAGGTHLRILFDRNQMHRRLVAHSHVLN